MQPTMQQLQDDITMTKNMLLAIMREAGIEVSPALFNRLPTQPTDYFPENPEEYEKADCEPKLSKWHCRNMCRVCTQYQEFA